MFQSHKTTKSLNWHAARKSADGHMSHPTDSPSWKLVMINGPSLIRLKKKLKFFDLEYWKYLPVRHVLDVMHIEKNVYDSIIGTLLKIPGKNKDGIAATVYLLNMRVKLICNPSMDKYVLTCLQGLGICQEQRRERFAFFLWVSVTRGQSEPQLTGIQGGAMVHLYPHYSLHHGVRVPKGTRGATVKHAD
ncbi:hypothetical protein L3X38_011421 [Prunus dulcis]|uniref:Uncharacterized protein n=1 Tax=Prunus dulcis TaxID=3755 RepID=A0AAD4WHH5_PRUDU|nr:hypothetical protein L3X38_011421 [Prunus dulcis]